MKTSLLPGAGKIDRERVEFLGGEWIEKPLGTLDHSEIERRLVEFHRRDFRRMGRPVHELTIRLGNDIVIPDVAVCRAANPFLIFASRCVHRANV